MLNAVQSSLILELRCFFEILSELDGFARRKVGEGKSLVRSDLDRLRPSYDFVHNERQASDVGGLLLFGEP